MIQIKNIEEAQLMNNILIEMLEGKTNFNMIPHKIGINYKYFTSLIKRIVDYNDSYERIIKYTNTEDYYNFRSIHESEEFIKNGGFESVFQNIIGEDEQKNKISNLKTRNLELQNQALEYEETIRVQKQTIRDLQQTDLQLSIFQKYWWLIGFVIGLISWFHKEIVYIIRNILK